jgi:hypothetical protein
MRGTADDAERGASAMLHAMETEGSFDEAQDRL